MFASLKNKIREETGSDVVIKVNTPFGKRAPSRGRHSRTGSTTSLNSVMSTDGIREEQDVSPISCKIYEDEFQKILAKKEAEFEKIVKDKELEWKKRLDEQETEKELICKEKSELDKRVTELEELLKITEEQKRKLAAYREDKEQLENLQTQEIAKVKQLLLQREKELAEKTTSLKENTDLVETLRAQLSRLRHSEQELSCVQENTDEQIKELRERLSNAELHADNVQADYRRAVASIDVEKSKNIELTTEITQLKSNLQKEEDKCKELCSSYEKERSDKDATLLRNAQVSQEVEIARQRIANQDSEIVEITNKLSDMERMLLDKDSQLSKTEAEIVNLKTNVSKLEEDVLERDKSIKILQQRLSIMKKTLQRELRTTDSTADDHESFTNSINTGSGSSGAGNNSAVLQTTSQTTKNVGNSDPPKIITNDEEDINFKYLKHVIIKFLTSREYEAKHLTRAVATLLKFSPEEERLLHETLEWKMSWFGSRPKVGNGQLAKAIPPS